jgi:hypothetical protein
MIPLGHLVHAMYPCTEAIIPVTAGNFEKMPVLVMAASRSNQNYELEAIMDG